MMSRFLVTRKSKGASNEPWHRGPVKFTMVDVSTNFVCYFRIAGDSIEIRDYRQGFGPFAKAENVTAITMYDSHDYAPTYAVSYSGIYDDVHTFKIL